MEKYKIEGNINFQEELYKMLDEESDDEEQLCQITRLPLKDKYVTLECKHHFNYDSLYREICKQKYEFKTYEPKSLSKKDLQKFRDSKLDYFIKCPYCRNIQFTVLPYYKELSLKKIYGINSLDKPKPLQQYVLVEDLVCNAILKSGKNKGKACGCKKIGSNGLCKRHIPKK